MSGGVRNPNLPVRPSEWVGSRHKPAKHKTFEHTDPVIKLPCVGSTREQRRRAGETSALADFTRLQYERGAALLPASLGRRLPHEITTKSGSPLEFWNADENVPLLCIYRTDTIEWVYMHTNNPITGKKSVYVHLNHTISGKRTLFT